MKLLPQLLDMLWVETYVSQVMWLIGRLHHIEGVLVIKIMEVCDMYGQMISPRGKPFTL
jgi:hypothetical protein